MVPIGRACHDWIGLNPVAAEAEGWAQWGMRNVRGSCTVLDMAKTSAEIIASQARVAMTIRVNREAKQWVADNAEAYSVNESVVVRAMLSVATRHPADVIKAIEAIKAAG